MGGSKTHTLTAANLPAHTHGFSGTTGGTAATVTVSDPGHNHTQNAHNHAASVGVTGADDNNHTGNGDWVADSDAGYKYQRGVSVANTTATNNAATTGITASSAAHTHTYSGTTDGGAGTSAAVSNLMPYFVLKYIIKTASSVQASDTLLDGRISNLESKLTGVTQAADVNHTHTWNDISNAPGGYDMTAAGTIVQTGAPTIPAGWLLADGSAVSRTTYSALFAAIGTTYGTGDGSTTFNLPNLKGKSVKGYDSTQAEFNIMGETGGEKYHTLSQAEMPAHNHSILITDPGHTHVQNAHGHGWSGVNDFAAVTSSAGNYPFNMAQDRANNWTGTTGNIGQTTATNQTASTGVTATSANTGGSTAFNVLDPYITLYFMIKYTAATTADAAFETRLNNNNTAISTAQSNITSLQSQMTTHTITWNRVTSVPARLGPTSAVTTDWNTAIETGAYISNNGANAPTTGAGVLYMGTVQVSTNTNYITQEVHEYNADSSTNTKTWRRDSNDVSGVRTWNPWYRVFQSQAEMESLIAVTPGTGGDSMPIGSIVQTSGSSTPTGWLVADGSAVSRTTYANLFAAIGTTYGTGDGSTTFNLPNLKGKVVVGQDATQAEFTAIGQTGGEKYHTLTTAEMASHTHTATVTDPGHNHSQNSHNHTQNPHSHNYYYGSDTSYADWPLANSWGSSVTYAVGTDGGWNHVSIAANTATNNAFTATNNASGSSLTVSNSSVGSASPTAFTNMSPYIVLRYIIKATPSASQDPALLARVTAAETSLAAKAPIANPALTGNVSASSQVSFMIKGTGAYHSGAAWLDRGLWQNSAGTSTATVDYNTGSAWNASTGAFTAPQAGVYAFFAGGWSSYNGYGVRYAYSFYVNGVQKYISGGAYSTTDSPMTTTNVALKLNAGDTVKLYMYSGAAANLGTTTYPMYWGGYLLG